MIKIAIAGALAAIVVADVAVPTASSPASVTIERPRGLKGDRLPVLAPNTGCADAARPFNRDECIRVREQPAGTITPTVSPMTGTMRTAFVAASDNT